MELYPKDVIKDIWIKMKKFAQEYGCTHVALIDGCSRMISGYASMEVKNPILSYEYVFRPAILKYGLQNQLRIDHGQEFSFCIFVQNLLKNYGQSTEKEPWKQTTSTQNNIEHFWPELSSRVTYPVKRALISIIEENDYSMSGSSFNLLQPGVAYLYPLKTSENLKVF